MVEEAVIAMHSESQKKKKISFKEPSVADAEGMLHEAMRSKAAGIHQLEAVEEGLIRLLASQKAARFHAEERWEALEEQGRCLEHQVKSIRKLLEDERNGAKAKEEHRRPSEPEGAPNAGDGAQPENLALSSEEPAKATHMLRTESSVIEITQGVDLEMTYAQSQRDEDTCWWRRMVRSPHFDLAVGVLIVANTLVMSLELEYDGEKLYKEYLDPDCVTNCSGVNPSVELAFNVLEHIFTALFFSELMLRLAADGCSYLRSWANLGDAAIVVVSSVDSWVITPLQKAKGQSGMQNVAILRLVRLVRLSKVFRVVRVMKAFKSLRVLVSAVAASVGALAWSMTLLFVLELMGAIFLAQVLRPFIEDPSRDASSREFLWKRFGTWVRAMLTVFEITMAPGGFINYRRISEEVHPIFGLFFAAYVCVVTFAVVRVITAMFLKATLSASDQDEARLASDRAGAREAYANRLRIALEGENEDFIDEEDLSKLLQIQRMKEWLEEVELLPAEAERLFRALEHGHGRASFTDFVGALQRMRGPPRAADTVVTLCESRKILERLSDIEEAMNQSPWKIRKNAGARRIRTGSADSGSPPVNRQSQRSSAEAALGL